MGHRANAPDRTQSIHRILFEMGTSGVLSDCWLVGVVRAEKWEKCSTSRLHSLLLSFHLSPVAELTAQSMFYRWPQSSTMVSRNLHTSTGLVFNRGDCAWAQMQLQRKHLHWARSVQKVQSSKFKDSKENCGLSVVTALVRVWCNGSGYHGCKRLEQTPLEGAKYRNAKAAPKAATPALAWILKCKGEYWYFCPVVCEIKIKGYRLRLTCIIPACCTFVTSPLPILHPFFRKLLVHDFSRYSWLFPDISLNPKAAPWSTSPTRDIVQHCGKLWNHRCPPKSEQPQKAVEDVPLRPWDPGRLPNHSEHTKTYEIEPQTPQRWESRVSASMSPSQEAYKIRMQLLLYHCSLMCKMAWIPKQVSPVWFTL